MHYSWRRDLAEYLAGFVAGHRGLRSGLMFGMPAAYAGRRLFSCAFEDGITARLPADAVAAAIELGATPWRPIPPRVGVARKTKRPAAKTKRPVTHRWVIFRPRTRRAAEAIGPFLEIAARHVALDDSPLGPAAE